MTKFYTFFLNPTIWLAAVLALMTSFISSPLVAAVVLVVAVTLFVIAAFQSGRLPTLMSGPAGPLRRDPIKLVVDNDLLVPDRPLRRALTSWPHVRARLTATAAMGGSGTNLA